jgi:hypothetical protein
MAGRWVITPAWPLPGYRRREASKLSSAATATSMSEGSLRLTAWTVKCLAMGLRVWSSSRRASPVVLACLAVSPTNTTSGGPCPTAR